MTTKPSTVRLDNPTEHSFSVSWDPFPNAKGYKLIVREFPKEWSTAEVIVVEGNATRMEVVEGRFPTSTYQVRLVAVLQDGSDSPPSDEATIDTAVANCTPEKKSSKCTIS